jgi:acyl-coenzyme A synthetase/AMP-(fatty) acid ligase
MFGRRPAGLASLDDSAPVLAPMPMGTASSAMTAGLLPLNSLAPVVVCRPGDIERMGELIARCHIATLLLTPWIAMRMVAAGLQERHDLSSVTTVAIASAPLPATTAIALTTMMPGLSINTAYAQGEAVPAVVLGTFDPRRPTALGRPAPGTDLLVVGEDDQPVANGAIGEIWLRSAAPKRLYLDETLNAQRRADGWTRTRDLGYVGADGDLYLFDRAVDAIHTNGRLVSSIEVEGALYAHPAVREAAVFGVPDPDRGEAVAAALVLTSPDAEPHVLASLADRLDPHQIPVATHLLNELPRGASGKVLKYQLSVRTSSCYQAVLSRTGRRQATDASEVAALRR